MESYKSGIKQFASGSMDMKCEKISYSEANEECKKPSQASVPEGVYVGLVSNI